MVKHTLSVFDHFMNLALKGLKEFSSGCLEIHTNAWDTEKTFGIGVLKKIPPPLNYTEFCFSISYLILSKFERVN